MAAKKERKEKETRTAEKDEKFGSEETIKEGAIKTGIENIEFPKLSEEAKKKLEVMKEKLDRFTSHITKENKEIIGVALLPPSKLPEHEEKLSHEEIEELKKKINVLVLVITEDRKDWYELKEKVIKNVTKTAKEVDENISPVIMDLYELRENCFDGKYEILEAIAIGAPLYDSKDMLAAIKICEVHKNMVLRKFEKYIVSYVAVGSLFRGDATSADIDVAVVVDDTDVKKMTRAELKDKLGAIIRGMGYDVAGITGVKKAFHVQTYILTDFWDAIKDAHPVIYTFLRDGVPLFDRGVFTPWKLLLKMGRIRPSPEAIDMQMDIGERLIQRTKGKMLSILGEDLYYAILNPAQAALMLYGIAPPTPKETIDLMDEIFVRKEKLLEKRYIDILTKIRKYYKDIEHGEVKEVSGKDIDELLKDSEDYMKRIKKLFEQIQSRRDKESVDEIYNACISIAEDALRADGIKVEAKQKVLEAFKKNLVDKKFLPQKYYDLLHLITTTKRVYATKKLSSPELEKVRKEARIFIKDIIEYVQRKKGYELERAKIRFKYGDKFGDAILLDNFAYLVHDIDSEKKEVSKARIRPDGSLGDLESSSMEELEKQITRVEIPKKVFIKEKIFEDLRRLFGKDVEILINY